MIIFAFWSLSAFLPGISLWLWREKASPPVSPGLAWVSLPAGIGIREDPLEKWRFWSRWPMVESSHEADGVSMPLAHPPVHADTPLSPIPQVRLIGIVSMEGITRYCFLDTQEERWFRLGVGETDAVSGLRLRRSGTGGMLYLEEVSGQPVLLIESDALLKAVPHPLKR